MSNTYTHYRLLSFSVDERPAGGLLDALRLETRRGQTDLLFDFHALQLSAPPILFEQDGRLWESLRGQYVARRLRFANVKIVQGESVGASLVDLPPQHPDRRLYAEWAWRTLEGQNTYLIDLLRQKDDTLLLEAGGCSGEERQGPVWKADVERNWSPPPASPARMIPSPKRLQQRFGGDPVTVRLNGRDQPLRLFVGGLETQSSQRPQVGAVLNLGENASVWCEDKPVDPADRWAHKGEGSHGMNARDLAEEAGWVIERLKRGERVLVHCSAGMNRSSSVCCAVLILLEGLSAEAALERLRLHHPWARPDPRHWLALRWLASNR
jgi:hypothetical protein